MFYFVVNASIISWAFFSLCCSHSFHFCLFMSMKWEWKRKAFWARSIVRSINRATIHAKRAPSIQKTISAALPYFFRLLSSCPVNERRNERVYCRLMIIFTKFMAIQMTWIVWRTFCNMYDTICASMCSSLVDVYFALDDFGDWM